jgi:nitrilase
MSMPSMKSTKSVNTQDAGGSFKTAVVQATPILLDRDATVDKACNLITEAGRGEAKLALFPECFIPGYPLWVWFIPPYETKVLRELYTELLDNSVTIPSPTTDRLCEAAADAGVHIGIGINERNAEASGASLYNTLLYISAEGKIIGKHRKLIPTAAERLVHARGDGDTLDVYDLPGVGKVGGLICWENYMPLARYALTGWGMQILLAPTWDRGEPWTSTLRHSAKETRSYVLGCCSAMHRDNIPDRLSFKQKYIPEKVEWLNPGMSTIIDPDGKFVVEPVEKREEILYAEIKPELLRGPRYQLDTAGHYGRPDVFELTVHRQPRPMVRTESPPTET